MNAKTPTLVVENIAVDFGNQRVLENTNLTVQHGELLGLIGPNGAGKTTLLRTILGLLRPTTGRTLIAGRLTKPGRTVTGYVPQRHEFSWDYPVSVSAAVMTGLTGRLGFLRRPGVGDWEAVTHAIEQVQMTALANKPVGQLSGGQRQRILVARALALRPSLLLLDEPCTGLDMPTQELLYELFSDLAHKGCAIIMTTHDLISAFYSCYRLALINRTVVATGTPAELAICPKVWMSTFGVGSDNPLLRILKAVSNP